MQPGTVAGSPCAVSQPKSEKAIASLASAGTPSSSLGTIRAPPARAASMAIRTGLRTPPPETTTVSRRWRRISAATVSAVSAASVASRSGRGSPYGDATLAR